MQFEMLSLFTDQFEAMKRFYADVLAFEVKQEVDGYVEFGGQSIRFAICTRETMRNVVEGTHYDARPSGQSFGLAFPCENTDAIDRKYRELIDHGAVPVQAGKIMPWNQYTAFFADPDGHVHELFAWLEPTE